MAIKRGAAEEEKKKKLFNVLIKTIVTCYVLCALSG